MVFQFPGTERVKPRQLSTFTASELRTLTEIAPVIRMLLTVKKRRPNGYYVVRQFLGGLVDELQTKGGA